MTTCVGYITNSDASRQLFFALLKYPNCLYTYWPRSSPRITDRDFPSLISGLVSFLKDKRHDRDLLIGQNKITLSFSVKTMRELRPFKLPQLVEDRVNEKKIDTSESAPIGHGLYLSTSSTPSEDLSSAPTTPTVSLRLHSRFPSSASSLASSPTMRESIDGFGSQKTPLSDVKEEPLEREESFQMVESLNIISKGRSLTVFLDL